MDDQLLGELDKSSIASPQHRASSSPRPMSRDGVDKELDLIGQKWVQTDEFFLAEVPLARGGIETSVFLQTISVLPKDFTDGIGSFGCFFQNTAGYNLFNITGNQIHRDGKTISHSR